MKTLIIGQAPSRLSDPAEPLSGRSGRRLALLCGLDRDAFLKTFLRANVHEMFQGKAGKGDNFPCTVADDRLGQLMKLMNRRRVVLLGARVAQVFCHRAPAFHWVQESHWIEGFPRCSFAAALCPHPSGVSRFWNDPANVERARQFWRTLAEESHP